MKILFSQRIDRIYNSIRIGVGSQTTLDKRRFDEGWVDSGEVIKLQDVLE